MYHKSCKLVVKDDCTVIEYVIHIYPFLIQFYRPMMINGSLQMCVINGVVHWPLGN